MKSGVIEHDMLDGCIFIVSPVKMLISSILLDFSIRTFRQIQLTRIQQSPVFTQIINCFMWLILALFLFPLFRLSTLNFQIFLLDIFLLGWKWPTNISRNLSFFLEEFLICQVTLVKGLLVDLVFLAELFHRQPMTILKMHVDNHSGILSIIFACESFFVFQLQHLLVQEVDLLHVVDTSVLVAELIQVILYFYFSRWQFIAWIWLVHFWNYFRLLLNCYYGPIAICAPGLCSNVLNETILARWTFFRIVGSYVDCVHWFEVRNIIIS